MHYSYQFPADAVIVMFQNASSTIDRVQLIVRSHRIVVGDRSNLASEVLFTQSVTHNHQ